MQTTTVAAALQNLEGITTWAAWQTGEVGKPDRVNQCPVANWLKATVVGLRAVAVGQWRVEIEYTNNDCRSYPTGTELQKLIHDIDASQHRVIRAKWLQERLGLCENQP